VFIRKPTKAANTADSRALWQLSSQLGYSEAGQGCYTDVSDMA
jgi:hypothetical protein